MRIFITCIIILSLVIFSIPYIASTTWGNQVLTNYINSKKTNRSFQAEKINLSWLGPQTATKIIYKEPNGTEIFTSELVSVDSSFFNLLLKNIPSGVELKNLNASLKNQTGSVLEIKNVNGFMKLGAQELPISLQLSGTTRQGDLSGTFNIDAQIPLSDLQNLLQANTKEFDFQNEKINIKAHAINFPVDLLDEFISYSKPELKGILGLLLGKKLDFTLEQNPANQGISLSLQANSPSAQIELLSIFNGQYLTLTKSGKINLIVTPELTKRFLPNIALTQPANADVQIEELFLPIKENGKSIDINFDQMALKADLHIPDIQLRPLSNSNELTLKNLNMSLNTNGNDKTIQLSINSETTQHGHSIAINLTGSIDKPSSLDDSLIAGLHLHAGINGIPLASMANLIGLDQEKSQELGLHGSLLSIPHFAIKVEGNPFLAKKFSGSFVVDEITLSNQFPLLQKFHANWEANARDNTISMDFKGTAQTPGNTAEGEFLGDLLINDWLHKEKIDFSRATADFKTNFQQFPTSLLNLFSGSHDLLPLFGQAIDFTLKGKAYFAQLDESVGDFYLHSDLLNAKATLKFDVMNFEATSNDRNQADFNIKGKIDKFITSQGKLNWDQSRLNIEANMLQISSDLIAKVAGLTQSQVNQLEALIGSHFDTNLNLQLKTMTGPIYVKITGNRGQFLLDSKLEGNRLFLNQPLTAEITPSPALGKLLLEDYAPLLDGILGGENPIRININHQGFVFPLFPFDPTLMQIPNATVDAGKLYFSNTGQLNKIMGILGLHTADQITMWFTPLYFSLLNGILKIERVDVLIGQQYPIATWGTINLIEDRVRMIIGLSGAAISKAFNITVSNKDFMLQIPLTGTLSNASIDKTKTTARITALIAQSKARGSILGTVLNIASGKEEKVPNPTTTPLPWSDLLKEEPEQKSTNEKLDPAKEIQKGAESILKKLFSS